MCACLARRVREQPPDDVPAQPREPARHLQPAGGGVPRLEIPEDLQNKFGFAPLGPAAGVVKRMIFGFNSAGLYNLEIGPKPMAMPRDYRDRLAALEAEYLKSRPLTTPLTQTDKLTVLKEEHTEEGPGRSNTYRGWIGAPFA
jgi:hypothetical protein